MTTISINEAPPCEVAYLSEGEKTFVKLNKEDFDRILNERREAILMSKLWLGMALLTAVVLGFSVYWFTEHPVTRIVLTAPASTN